MKFRFNSKWVAGILAGLLLPLPVQTAWAADPADADTNTPAASTSKATDDSSNAVAAASNIPSSGASVTGVERESLVSIGKSVELKAGDSAQVVVVIGGSAVINGKVRENVTVVGGNLEINGEVGQEVVTVMGNIKVGPQATLHRQAVVVGGKVDVAPGATVEGKPIEVDITGLGIHQPEWIKSWFLNCFLMFRPLAPQVGWLWIFTGIVFLFYLLIAAVFTRPVEACVYELNRRPATTFLLGLLTKMLLPLIFVILAITVIGIIVIPFIAAALFLGAIVGKVALCEWLGLKLGRQFGSGTWAKPVVAFIVGWLVITLLYMVPILGLVTFLVVSIWGLGSAVAAAFGGFKREQPEKPAAPLSRPPAPEPAMAYAAASAPTASAAFAPAGASPEVQNRSASAAVAEAAPAPTSLPGSPPVMPEVLSYPRSGFWERMGAGFLDFVLVVIVSALAGLMHYFPAFFIVALAYFAGMWAWKGTTIGGIVLGLKVVRVDGEPVTFAIALVRALAGAFSIVVLFLGMFWIGWDAEKQGWHDKIAGTVVLHLPRGTPLLCL